MELAGDQAADAVERYDCPKCAAPAGSTCRTQDGKTAIKHHTARFILVPALREELEVAVEGVPAPEIAKRLTIKASRNAGKNLSVASLYRALGGAGKTAMIPGPARALAPRSGGSLDRERVRP